MQKPYHIINPYTDIYEFIKQNKVKVGHIIDVIGERRESEQRYRVIQGEDGQKALEAIYLGWGGTRQRLRRGRKHTLRRKHTNRRKHTLRRRKN